LAEVVVFDSSAILAVLYKEPGSLAVSDALADPDRAVLVSSVNLCEVITKLVLGGATDSNVKVSIKPFLPYVVDFDSELALLAGELSRSSRKLGLSLGDRACLALAVSRGATAWTTDAAWLKLKTGVKIHLLRG
jgi:PIN domain nuclease of toxin-antitoxin system